ncbi:hypothetical protein, partial [Bacteroides acidifaciens]|uniref:hypothetical protein n=3 Tax=Bacteroides TaxID=816 RepID=UPI0025AF1EF0
VHFCTGMNHFLGIWLCTESNPQNFKLSQRYLFVGLPPKRGSADFFYCPPFRDGQGSQKAIKKVPQNIDFVGLVFFLSPFGFSFGDPPGAFTVADYIFDF